MHFTKMQGAGNDFVVVDARKMERDWPKLAREMCDRHFGVGSDGLVLVLPSGIADFRMRMFNPDGSEAEMCGNGVRCFAKYIAEKGLRQKARELAIETLAGIRKVVLATEDGRVARVQVGMGKPILDPAGIPVRLQQAGRGDDPVDIIRYALTIDGRELDLCFVSMGNPHAVCFIDEPVADFPLTLIGPKVENHDLFPQRTNFEIVNVLDKARLDARVWERGAGLTLACGTGACGIAVAARLAKGTSREVEVNLPGGTLAISWDLEGEVLLSGPAEFVFEGEWPER